MARSRSSFDVESAIATATSLASTTDATRKKERVSSLTPPSAPLVSFGSRPPPPPAPLVEPEPTSGPPLSTAAFEDAAPSSDLLPASTAGMMGERGLRSALPPFADDIVSVRGMTIEQPSLVSTDTATAPSGPLSDRLDDAVRELANGRALPRFPDLTVALGPMLRCEKVVEWIALVTGATDVFLADAAGLPFAGAIRDMEARLAASGLIASAVGSLIAALPGGPSQRFELHVGEGPYFELIGLEVSSAAYVVGMMRADPLSPRQAHAIRVACRHALAATLGVAR
jgi:hypothetical protein